ELRVHHALLHHRTGLNPTLENLLWLAAALREFLLVNYQPDAGFFGGDGNDPEPFVFQADDDGVAACVAGIEANAGEMPENSEFFEARMNDAQTLLIAGQVGASAGVNDECRTKPVNFPVGVARLEVYAAGVGTGFRHRPAFADLGAGRAGVPEQDVIERGAFDLDDFMFAGEFAKAKDETRVQRTIAEMELRAEFFGEARGPEGRQQAEFAEDHLVVGQQRFTDVEAGENFLFEHQHAFA